MGRYNIATITPLIVLLLLMHWANGISVMRAAKCVIPNGLEHSSRAVLLQQCLSKNYGQGNETSCYDELGCFPMDKPWTSLLRPLPSPLHPAEINVRLYCYTRESPERYNITLWPEIDLEGCNFNPCRKTAFVVHGFASNGNNSWLADLKDNYLKMKDVNVFLVDWGSGAELLNYLQVASNTRIVGAEVARFLKWLIKNKGLDSGDVHLMGHSLGAHICSYAAKAVPGIERLTAMDPAQPGFEGTDKTVRLDKEDANYVEVLHTNAAPFIPLLGFGLIFPVGHVDIYLNGGLRQPGCQLPDFTEIKSIKDLAKFPVEFIGKLVACSHGRSYEYFTNVLQDDCTIWCKLAGVTRHLLNGVTLGYIDPLFSRVQKCDAKVCIPLGLDTPDYTARGVFAATTSNNYPYCETDPKVNSRMLREICETIGEVTTAATDIVDGVVEGVAEGVKTVAGKGKDLVSGTADKGKDVISGVADKGKEAVSSIRGLIRH
ncbi:pancreatic triacylglycerol lipase-like isoform X2 [Macrosteles quadrilineatus]|nr:pancreatic triacylglycerol lipase-like isoform X2 [Macrosteles quadrilineatus]